MISKVERFAASFYGILRRDPFLKFERGRLRRLARRLIRRLEPSAEELKPIREIMGDWVPAFSEFDRGIMTEQLKEDLRWYGGTCDDVEGVVDDFLKNVFPNTDIDYMNSYELAREIYIYNHFRFFPEAALSEGVPMEDFIAMQRAQYRARNWSRSILNTYLMELGCEVVMQRHGDIVERENSLAIYLSNDFKSFYPEVIELYTKAGRATLAEAKRFQLEFEATDPNLVETAIRLEKITPELVVPEEFTIKKSAQGAKRKTKKKKDQQ